MKKCYSTWYIDETIKDIRNNEENREKYIEDLRKGLAWFREVLNYMPDTEKIKKSTVKALEEFQKKPYLQNREILKNLEHAGSILAKQEKTLRHLISFCYPAEEVSEELLPSSVPLSVTGAFKKDESLIEKLEQAKKKSDILELLPYFNELSGEKIEKISSRIKLRRYDRNTVLFNEGETARDIYIIKTGEIKLYKKINSHIIDIAGLNRGDMFGEMGVISDEPRTLSATVFSGRAELYVISGSDFLNILHNYYELRLKLARILCNRTEESCSRLIKQYVHGKDMEKLLIATRKSEIIGSISLFDSCSPDEIERISRRTKLRRYEKGTVLFNEGDIPDGVYIIKSGEITLYKDDETGDFIKMGKGDLFGEMGVITDKSRTFSAVISSNKSELYFISKTDFIYMIKNFYYLSLNLFRLLGRRINENNRHFFDIFLKKR